MQVQGNATLGSTLALIKDQMLEIQRRYIFIQLGGNQVRSADRVKIYSQVLELVVAICNKSPDSRIFFIGVLPRIVDNCDIKPFIVKFNRWLASAVCEVDVVFKKIKFLPVHLKFLDGVIPKRNMFNTQNNSLLLSSTGAVYFREVTFQMAGFVKNSA